MGEQGGETGDGAFTWAGPEGTAQTKGLSPPPTSTWHATQCNPSPPVPPPHPGGGSRVSSALKDEIKLREREVGKWGCRQAPPQCCRRPGQEEGAEALPVALQLPPGLSPFTWGSSPATSPQRGPRCP